MEGGFGPGKGPAKNSEKKDSSIENNELKKDAALFCSMKISNDELDVARSVFVQKYFDAHEPDRKKREDTAVEHSLRFPEYVPLMMFTGAPVKLQNRILKEYTHGFDSNIVPITQFKKEVVEDLGKKFSPESWDTLSKIAKSFWEVKLADFPVPEGQFPEKLLEYVNQAKSARQWIGKVVPQDDRYGAAPVYRKTMYGMAPEKGSIGKEIEDAYRAFIMHHASNPKAQQKLLKEYALIERSQHLERQGYFQELEESFFLGHMGNKDASPEEVREILASEVSKTVPAKLLSEYIAGASKHYTKLDFLVFLEYLKTHPQASWSSIAVMSGDKTVCGWFAGGRSFNDMQQLVRAEFSNPTLNDIRKTDDVFLRTQFRDMMTMLSGSEYGSTNVFLRKTLEGAFDHQGGLDAQPMHRVLTYLRIRLGRILPKGTSSGVLNSLLAVHDARTNFLESFVGINIQQFDHLRRVLANIEPMAEQARYATSSDVATKQHFALRARMMLEEDFNDRIADVEMEGPLPYVYKTMYASRLEKINKDLEIAESQLRAAGLE